MTQIELLLKEHAEALARRETARQAFVAADADARGLMELCFEEARAGVPGASLDYNMDWLIAGHKAVKAQHQSLLADTSVSEITEARRRWRRSLLEH